MRFQQFATIFGVINGVWSLAVPQGSIESVNSVRHQLRYANAATNIARRDSNAQLTQLLSEKGVIPGKNLNSVPSSNIWVGENGPWKVKVNNTKSEPMALVVWSAADGGDSFVQVHQPVVTYWLGPHEAVVLSIADGVKQNAFTALYSSTPMQWGYIANAWVEFTTGAYATIDVSREPNMNGDKVRISGMSTGCVSDSGKGLCTFQCKPEKTTIGAAPYFVPSCWESGTYDLVGCDFHSNPGASYGVAYGNPSGGCLMGDYASSNIVVDFY